MKKLSKSKKFKSKRSNSKKSSSNRLFLTLSLILLSSFAFISVIKAEDPISTCDPITGLNPDGTNIGCGYIPSNDVIDSSIITHDPLVTLPADSSTTNDSSTNPISTCDPMTGLNPDGTNIGCSPVSGTSDTSATTYQPITTNESAAHESATTNESAVNESTTAHEPTVTSAAASTHEDTAEKNKTKKKNGTTSAVNKATEEHMNEVAKHVKILSETKDDKNGIGQEVQEIAGAQDASQIRIAEKLAKMHSKSIWLKKIVGYDHEAVSSIQEEMAEIRLRIQEIYAIQEQTKDKLAMSQLEDAANALIEQNAALDDSLQEEMHNVGVWGWFENLIRKGHASYSARFGS